MGDSGWPSSGEGRQVTRALVGGLAGANGWCRVSMHQMAEAAGPSPARPTTPGLSCANASPLSLAIAAAPVRRLRTAD
jgi:hypothetical protein